MRCSSNTRFWRFPHFMFKFNPMSMRKICHGQAAVVHTGQHGCRETSHCQGAMLQTTSRCVSGFKGALSKEKMYKTCAFKNTIWGLTCLLYKQNQVFCLPAFFGFSDKVPLNQYWNFIIFRLGWLTATSESVQWPFARRTSGSHLDSSPTNHESKRATSPSIGYSPCAP